MLLGLCLAFISLVAFDNQDKLELTNAEITVNESERVLRYDFTIKNTGDAVIKSEFDYPGQHPLGFEFVVRPNNNLATHMVMEDNTTYEKMLSMGSGQKEYFEPGTEMPIHLEYKIKDNADLDQVEQLAKDATLLILDGVDIAMEIAIKDTKQ